MGLFQNMYCNFFQLHRLKQVTRKIIVPQWKETTPMAEKKVTAEKNFFEMDEE